MKNVITMLLVITGFTAGAQNFEKYFPYLGQSLNSAVFIYDDGYVMAGFTNDGSIPGYFYVVKTDLIGDTIWCKKMPEVNEGSYSYLRSYTEDANGNIYLAVNYNATADIVKMSPDWDIVWKKKINADFQILNIANSKDNNLLYVGLEKDTAYNVYKYNLYKMDTEGNILWKSERLNVFGYDVHYSLSIVEMDDNNIIVNTTVKSNYMDHIISAVISTLNHNGDTISSVLFYGYAFSDIYAVGNELFSAYVNTVYEYGPPTNHVIRFLPDGTILSEKVLQMPKDSYVENLMPTSENNYLAIGTELAYMNTKVIMCGINADGDSLWTSSLGNVKDIWYNSIDVKICADAGYVIAGAAKLTEVYIPFLAKTDSVGNFSSLGTNNEIKKTSLRIYPNPATENVAFEFDFSGKGFISISDLLGRPVAHLPVIAEKTVWDARQMANGVYFYRFQTNNFQGTGKIVISK